MGASSRNKRPKSNKPELPSEHDWRTTDAQEIDRRRQRARDEKMRIRNLTPEHSIFSNFHVHSASGRDYEVEIRGITPLECACECVDFRSNGLGTCKHVEAVLIDIQRRNRGALRDGVIGNSNRLDVVVDQQAASLRLKTADGTRIPAPVRRWFGDDTLLLPDAAPSDVVCDLPWNPARLEQRIARAWRKFQTQPVTVINLISEDTIESRMLETLATKRSIAESVLDRTTDATSSPILGPPVGPQPSPQSSNSSSPPPPIHSRTGVPSTPRWLAG